MKRIISFFLASFLLVGALLLAGCGGAPTESTATTATTSATVANSTTASSAETTGTDDKTPRKPEGYEDLDFGGKTFVIAAQDNSSGDGWYTTTEVYPDASMTDAISIAVRERNNIVEALYHCNIEMKAIANPPAVAAADISGQKYTIDLYTNEYGGTGLYTSGNNYNLCQYIDITNSWWDQNYVRDIKVKNAQNVDVLCGIAGDFSLTSFTCTHVMFYNKEVYQNAGIPYDLAELVRNGEWTMDIFTEILKNAAIDTSGDGNYRYADGDALGWVRVGQATHGMHAASALRIVENDNGAFRFSPTAQTDEWNSVINQAIEIWGVEEAETLEYSAVQNAIQDGAALFASEVLDVLRRMKDADCSIGLVPYPKYSESQDDYAHYVDNHFAPYCMPVSVTDPELTGHFFEVYAYHSQNTVRTAFINTYANNYSDGLENMEMLNIILDSRTYDPGYLYWSDVEGLISNMVSGSNNMQNFVSRYAGVMAERLQTFLTELSEKTSH